MRLCVFNLLWWGPYLLNAAVPNYLRPSGVARGAEVDRHVPRQSNVGSDEEEEGPDGVLPNLCSVLFAINRDQVIFSFLLKVVF
jgi:hypothetical protein